MTHTTPTGFRCHCDRTDDPAELTASAAPGSLTLTAALGVVDLTRRTITGTLVPPGVGVIGTTSVGPTRIAAGALTWADPRRVKLLVQHDENRSVGYATELGWSAAGLVGTFYVPEGPDGDEALLMASDGRRDGLSVRGRDLTASWASDGVLDVTAGQLAETSLVSIPAFDDSRVSVVRASHPTQPERLQMFTPEQLARLRAAGVDPTDLTASVAFLTAPPAPTAPALSGPTELSAAAVADELMTRLAEARVVPLGGPAPATHVGPGGELTAGLDLAGFADLVAAHARGELDNPAELRAALSDIVPADSPNAFRPAYLDELWKGTDYRRKFIDNATTPRPLPKAMKIIGHRWVTPPTVDDYAGNKAAIPSNEVELVDVPVDVKRLAGGHDVDRAYFDLGDPAWFAAYFEAQTEDYRKKSDARAATQALTDATALVDGGPDATPATFTTLLEGVVQGVIDLATLGEGVEYVALAPGLIAELFNVANIDAPAFFGGSFQLSNEGDGVLGGLKFFTSPGITAGQFLMGAKSGTRFHELPVPIRVQAVNVANGGVDLGVFGYYATYNRHVNQTRKGTVGA